MEESKPLPELVLVLGKTGVGKSTFIKTATGLDIEVGHGIQSSTQEVAIYPLPDSHIFFIDTPGFENSDRERSDTDILQAIASCLADLEEGLTFEGQMLNLSGVIYLHAINDGRIDLSMMKNLQMLLHLTGVESCKHLVFVTTKWTIEDRSKAEDRELELANQIEFWGKLLEAGATTTRFEDSKQSAVDIVQRIVAKGTFSPQLIREYVLQGKPLCETAAGRAIEPELAQARDQHKEALEDLRGKYAELLDNHSKRMDENLSQQILALKSRLGVLDDELSQLRTTRQEAQDHEDKLDLMIVSQYRDISEYEIAKTEKRHARHKRALRWFGRFAGLGTATAIAVLSHGAMAPVSLAIIGGVEQLCQEDKKRERERTGGTERGLLMERSGDVLTIASDVASGFSS